MPDYETLYYMLFNAMTNAMLNIDTCNYGVAKEVLIRAQQQAENTYIEQPEENADQG